MPHLTLEYTSNLNKLDTERALLALNHALVASGHFEDVDIKSRAVRFDDFLIGTTGGAHAFVHLKLSLLSGRSQLARNELSNALLRVLRASCKGISNDRLQMSVQIEEIDRPSYAKDVI
jgi:5-carboxymethyl-2-hydroxymuconate isomerase